MAASFFTPGFGTGGGSVTLPVSIANGGTGQTTANAAWNALAALALAQSCTSTLTDNITNTAPIARVLKHTSSGTTAAGFGIGDAVDLQNAVGNVRRVLTRIPSFVVATDTLEEILEDLSAMVGGTLAPHHRSSWVGGSANNPAIYLGNPASTIGILRATNNFQISVGSAVLDCSASAVTSLIRFVASKRFQQTQGATVASANTLTVGTDGNVFPISGTTTINGIVTTTWSAGAIIYLKFAGICTVTHNSGTPGAGAVAIKTTTAANVNSAANSIMTLMYDGTFWVQTCPITPGY